MEGQDEGGMGGGSGCKDRSELPFNIAIEGITGCCL